MSLYKSLNINATMFARKQDSDLCTDICQWVPLSFLGNALFRTENNNPKVQMERRQMKRLIVIKCGYGRPVIIHKR